MLRNEPVTLGLGYAWHTSVPRPDAVPDGTLRDTVVSSVRLHEWPAVRMGLTERLARR